MTLTNASAGVLSRGSALLWPNPVRNWAKRGEEPIWRWMQC